MKPEEMEKIMYAEDEAAYKNLSDKEKHIVEILINHEREISDGYGHYCDDRYYYRTLRDIALEILEKIK